MPAAAANDDHAPDSKPGGLGHFTDEEWNTFREIAFRVARRLGLQLHDGMDVAMVTMAQLFDLIRAGQPPTYPNGWVRTTAARRTYDLMRLKDRAAVTRSGDEIELERSDSESEEDQIVERLYACGMVEDLLAYAERTLSPKQYQALLEIYVYSGSGSTVNEMIRAVVEAAGGNPGEVASKRTHWRRAIDKLEPLLAEPRTDGVEGR